MAPIPSSFTDAAEAIAKDFDYSDDDVRKSVKHFLAQMRAYFRPDFGFNGLTQGR